MVTIKNKFTFDTTERPEISVNMIRHPTGVFEINGIGYRPEWERAPAGLDRIVYENLVSLGMKQARELYEGKRKTPDTFRIEKYHDGRITILLADH